MFQKTLFLKKIGQIVVSSFVGPFILNFIIWMLILDMQFLWLYIDDLMGKGLEWYIIIELLIYASANWVPMALPLSILMASIMTFGNLGENNELTAMKASGLSLFKIMKPLIVLIIFISVFAFYFTNSLWPIANFKMRVLLSDIQNTKIALALQPGVFFKSDEFSIRVAEKNDDGVSFKDILIYDRTQMKKQTLGAWSYNKDPRDFKRIIRAKQGRIISSGNKTALNLELEDGYIIQEWNPKSIGDSKMPFTRYYFQSATLNFNLESFNFQRSEEDTYQREQYLLNLNQIALLKDSSLKEQKDRNSSLNSYILNTFSSFRNNDSLNDNDIKSKTHFFFNQSEIEQKRDIKSAIRRAEQVKNHINIEIQKQKATEKYLASLSIEKHRKFTLSYAVLMLFFLGAPLGAIVKKGGLGWPVLISILFFLIYFMLTRAGEEMAGNASLSPIIGMWLSAICITPISLFIFYKSNKDSKLFDINFYSKLFKRKLL
mgnify:CR=1 FL=1